MNTAMPATVPAQIASRLRALGVHTGAVLRETGKTVTFHATMDDAAVVVKVLLTDEAMWVRHQQAEQAAYRTAEIEACPPPTAAMRYGDPQITIVDRIDGEILHPDRYPGRLPQATVQRVLDQLQPLYGWQPAGLARTPVSDTYLDEQATAGLLGAADRAAIAGLLAPGQVLRVEHGDPHSTNILITEHAVGFVDLEHMAWHLPGLDWAMMHLLWGPANPWLPAQLAHRAERDRITGQYAVNLMLLACREWRIHRETADFVALEPVLAANLDMARIHLHATYGSQR